MKVQELLNQCPVSVRFSHQTNKIMLSSLEYSEAHSVWFTVIIELTLSESKSIRNWVVDAVEAQTLAW